MGNIGHNSHSTHEQLKGFVAQYVKCDEESAALNDKRNEIRGKAEDLGIPSKAFQDSVSRAKADRKKKEGYDEGMKTMREVLGDINQDDLFAYLDRREEEKQKARELRAKEREKEKAKEDSFKAAPDRKPKNSKSTPERQREAAQIVAKQHAN
jgi:uncharacterized protein (UPF0335 family)